MSFRLYSSWNSLPNLSVNGHVRKLVFSANNLKNFFLVRSQTATRQNIKKQNHLSNTLIMFERDFHFSFKCIIELNSLLSSVTKFTYKLFCTVPDNLFRKEISFRMDWSPLIVHIRSSHCRHIQRHQERSKWRMKP